MSELKVRLLSSESGIGKYLSEDLLTNVGKTIVRIAIALLVYFVVSKIINKVSRVIVGRLVKKNIDNTVVVFLGSTIRVALKVLLAVGLLSSLGVTNATILAAFGSVTVGIGLALQGGMANFAGGVLIAFLKPFEIGDYIIEVGENNEGTVTKIDMFYTTIRTADDHMITIPNQMLTNSSVINLSKAGSRRLSLVVGISYEDDIDEAKGILKRLIEKDSRILKNKPADVFVDELAESSVNLGIHVFTKPEDYFPVKWDLNENIKKQFDQSGISIPYPQMDLHMEQKSGASR